MRLALPILALGTGVLLVSCAVGETGTTVAEPSHRGERAELCATDRSFSDVAAFGVSLADVGGTLAVGSPLRPSTGGSVLLFDEIAGSAAGSLDNATASSADGFGLGLAAFGTGYAVGAPTVGNGVVYLYDSTGALTQTIPNPGTSTGVGLFVVVPFPSCPFVLEPQHFTVWSERTAHVWYAPAEIEVAPG